MCDMFVYLGHTEQPPLLHQQCDSSIFDIFITSETMCSQALLQDAKQMKMAARHYGLYGA